MSTPTKSQSMNESDSEWNNPDFPFEVIEEEDGSFTFKWDENHPVTSVFNDYTEDDFIEMLRNAANNTIEQFESNS